MARPQRDNRRKPKRFREPPSPVVDGKTKCWRKLGKAQLGCNPTKLMKGKGGTIWLRAAQDEKLSDTDVALLGQVEDASIKMHGVPSISERNLELFLNLKNK